jgi:hypothetical protein
MLAEKGAGPEGAPPAGHQGETDARRRPLRPSPAPWTANRLAAWHAGQAVITPGKEQVMRHRAIAGTLALLVWVSPVIPHDTVHADETVCRGSLGNEAVDNLRVPSGARCSLDGTRVRGNIKVESGASLIARRIRVTGNVQAEGARAVSVLSGSTVGGNIQVKQGEAATVTKVRVDGDIQLESNDRPLSATDNTVGGNVQLFQNGGGVTVAGNTVGGNLQCKENRPPPRGGGNTVRGNKEDQCARL